MRPTVQFFLETWKNHFPPLGNTEKNFGVRTVSVKHQQVVLEGSGGRMVCFPLPEDMAVEDIYDDAFRILQAWQNWEQSLFELMANRSPLGTLAEQISRLLRTPFALLDETMNLLVRSAPAKADGDDAFDEFLSPEGLEPILRKAVHTKDGILLLSSEMNPERAYLLCVLQQKGKVLGAIVSESENEPFSVGQLDVVRCIAHDIGGYLETAVREEGNRDIRDGLLETLLSSSIADERRFLEFYENHGWGRDENLHLLTIVPTERLAGGWNVHMTLSALRLCFPGAAIALLRDRIALLVPEEEYQLSFVKQRAETERFLKERNLRAGISNELRGGNVLTEYNRQSAYAASQKRECSVVEYESVMLSHFVEMLSSGLDLVPYCNPVLVELSESEKENSRVLVDCLNAYLLNGRNISKTARSLGVNRNTLIYRLEKLDTLLGETVDELPGEKRMSLLLSCELLRRRNA